MHEQLLRILTYYCRVIDYKLLISFKIVLKKVNPDNKILIQPKPEQADNQTGLDMLKSLVILHVWFFAQVL